MAGTAGLPHVIVRFYTVKNVAAARWSAFWALLFIALLYLTAPAIGAFARYAMLDGLHGKTEAQLPEWFHSWEQTGLILWLDDGDGALSYTGTASNEIFRSGNLGTAQVAQIKQDHEQWLRGEASGRDGRAVLRQAGLSGPDRDIIVLATPEMAGLAAWIIAFVAAGGLAAALSTASGLLLVISSSVAHDIYFRIVNTEATEGQRLLVGRAVIGVAVIVAGFLGIYPPGFVSQVVAFAFGLAAASFFPVIVLGIFSRRVGTVPAIAGMIAGIGFTAIYILGSVYGGWSHWAFGIGPQGIGVVGMALNFLVTLTLTPFFPAPDQSIQDLILSIREPEGAGPGLNIDRSVEAD